MSTIDHKAEAERLLEQASKSTGDPTVWLLAAHVHADLYHAEQQRIANLIVLGETHVNEFAKDDVWGTPSLRADIRKGLNL